MPPEQPTTYETARQWVRFMKPYPTVWHVLIDHYGTALTGCGLHWRAWGETSQAPTPPQPFCRTCAKQPEVNA